MRYRLLFVPIIFLVFKAFPQQTVGKANKDTNYFYTDTIRNKVYFGQCQPTGIIATKGGYIVSTIFNIDFPEMRFTAAADTDTAKFWGDWRFFYARSHTSSGSVFKLNTQNKKDWELIFKEKRVKCIQPYDDTSFIAAGERTDQQKVWVARLNLITGKILWFNEFSARRNPGVAGLSISPKKDIIVLTDSKRIVPVYIGKPYGRTRIRFFSELPEGAGSRLMLLDISGDGKLKWNRRLPAKTNYDLFDNAVNAGETISVISDCSIRQRVNGKLSVDYYDLNYFYDLNGRKLGQQLIKIAGTRIGNASGWIYLSRSPNALIHIDRYDDKMVKNISTDIVLPQRYTALQSAVFKNNCYYFYGHTDINKILVCKLDIGFRLLASWAYQTGESLTDLQFDISANGENTIAGKSYSLAGDRDEHPYHINLIKFDLK